MNGKRDKETRVAARARVSDRDGASDSQKTAENKETYQKRLPKASQGMSQRIQKPQKINTKYVQNGVRGGSEAPWGAGPHFATNLACSLASIFPPK